MLQFYVTHEGKLKADNALLTGSFTSLGTENTKVVIGNGRMDLFINSNHCGGIASSYTSSNQQRYITIGRYWRKVFIIGTNRY